MLKPRASGNDREGKARKAPSGFIVQRKYWSRARGRCLGGGGDVRLRLALRQLHRACSAGTGSVGLLAQAGVVHPNVGGTVRLCAGSCLRRGKALLQVPTTGSVIYGQLRSVNKLLGIECRPMPPMARDDGNDNLELETRDMYVRKSNAAHRAPCMSHLIHYVHPSTGEGGLAIWELDPYEYNRYL